MVNKKESALAGYSVSALENLYIKADQFGTASGFCLRDIASEFQRRNQNGNSCVLGENAHSLKRNSESKKPESKSPKQKAGFSHPSDFSWGMRGIGQRGAIMAGSRR